MLPLPALIVATLLVTDAAPAAPVPAPAGAPAPGGRAATAVAEAPPATSGAKGPAKASPAGKAGRAPTSARRSARTAASAAGDSAASISRRGRSAPRTLEDIHIEGEIPAPQVLFITTRDQRRFMSFQHRRYLSTAQQLGEATVLPSDIVVTRAATTPERSHSDE
jgi:hypothetical protein